MLGRSDYHYRHEPLIYGFKPGAGRRGRGGAGWAGDDAQQSVIELPRPRAAREHPTMKPPELVAVALRNSSRPGQRVLDPFAGSGSTLVPAEALGREARLIELDPAYCDVIVERFERLSGERAERRGRGGAPPRPRPAGRARVRRCGGRVSATPTAGSRSAGPRS
jgi:DNA modification methylase